VCGVHRRQRPGSAGRRRTGGSGYTLQKGGIGRTSGGEAAAARLGEGTSTLRLVGTAAERRDSEAAARRAWQGQRLSGAPWRRARAAPRRASGCALGGGRRADKNGGKRNEWIKIMDEQFFFLKNEGVSGCWTGVVP